MADLPILTDLNEKLCLYIINTLFITQTKENKCHTDFEALHNF